MHIFVLRSKRIPKKNQIFLQKMLFGGHFIVFLTPYSNFIPEVDDVKKLIYNPKPITQEYYLYLDFQENRIKIVTAKEACFF